MPVGARVTVNGVGWGSTPVTIAYAALGNARIRVSKDGFLSAERAVNLTPESPARSLRFALRALDEPEE
jgi:hypothetical protein